MTYRPALKQEQWNHEAQFGFVPVLPHNLEHYSNSDETVSWQRSPTHSFFPSSWDKHCSLHKEKAYTHHLSFEKDISLLKWRQLNHTGNTQKVLQDLLYMLRCSVSPSPATASFSHQKGCTSCPRGPHGRRMLC